jgi:hypothetical protein
MKLLQSRSIRLVFWLLMAAMAGEVLFYTELPLLSPKAYAHKHLASILPVLVPHTVGGCLAIFLGPTQFFPGLRLRFPHLHRWAGWVYIGGVAVCGSLGMVLAGGAFTLSAFAVDVQASLLLICTGLAVAAILERDLRRHQRWMVRSYAVLFTFVLSRLPNPIPAYSNMSDDAFACTILFVSVLALLVADVGVEGF